MRRKPLALAMAVLLLLMVIPQTAYARDELKNTDPEKYYILLDLTNQIVTVYEKDDDGAYTRIVRRMVCTSGRTQIDPDIPDDQGTPTPRGIWKIGGRERFGKFASFAGEFARYWTQIVGGVYFHSAMYGKRDVDSFKSSAYNGLGSNKSHGCVRLYVEDAKWLYYYACPGTVVNVTSTPSNRELTRKLKSSIPFAEYNKLQKTFFDEPELPNFTAWTAVDGADMRTGNGSNDRRIAALPIGAEIEVLQYADPWCKIKYNEKEGYMKIAHLTLEKGVMQSREDADVIRSTCWIYQQPDSKSQELFKIPTSTTVKVLEEAENGYSKVAVWGVEGYVASSSLKKDWGLLLD